MRTFAMGAAVLVWSFGGAGFAEETQTLQPKVVEQKKEDKAADVKPADVKPAETKPAKAAAGAGFTNVSCTNGQNTRTLEITSPNAQTMLPCEVHYKKVTEEAGADKVLWDSPSNLSFCETKAQAFVEKLTSWGWTCNPM